MSQEPRTKNREPFTNEHLRAYWLAACFALMLVLSSRFLVLTPAQAQSQPPDLPTYTGWLREAYAAAQRGDRLGLEQAAERLIAAREVRLAGGGASPVDNSWLRAALADAEPNLPAIGARLGAILDALALPASAAPADALARLRAILDRPPFATSEPSTPGWLRSLLDWLGRLLERILRRSARWSRTAAWASPG